MYLNVKAVTIGFNNVGLTLTWDVFKLSKALKKLFYVNRLTLTWDVFKFFISIL